ncbi:MAG TPA: hypothetical protein ENG11_00265 [candidate division Zixibacteria bacterium]|nr:hypothetical protein [candidate division Zixibacteria bacterium]
MNIIDQILESVRKNLIENINFRAVLVGDEDIPVSSMPAARISSVAVLGSLRMSDVIAFTLTVRVELLFPPKFRKSDISEMILGTIEVLSLDIYPDGVRIIEPPRVQPGKKIRNNFVISYSLRWYED